MEKLGHRVRVVDDGRQAVAAFREEAFDVILMDMQMPVMSGLDATREIRSIENGVAEGPSRRVPIIGVSAFAQQSDVDLAVGVGMTDYLPKPVSLEKLRLLFQRLPGRDLAVS